jgi:hypothetical protein
MAEMRLPHQLAASGGWICIHNGLSAQAVPGEAEDAGSVERRPAQLYRFSLNAAAKTVS